MNKTIIVDQQTRIDKFLTTQLNQSRNQIEQLIKKGFVQVNSKTITKTSYKLNIDQQIDIDFPAPPSLEAKTVDFDVQIVYEDDDILVVNKPSGLVVHDAPSVKEATLVDWLKSKNISLSTISGEQRHGIVHRLDKGTSGLMVVAKTDTAHTILSQQLQDKTMGRYYLALIDLALKDDTTIEKPIGRNPNNRLKQAVITNGKWAKTSFIKLIENQTTKIELIAAKLFTGRTHQIRVHLESINRHILGDILYGFKGKKDKIDRVYLHAYNLYLTHPTTHKNMSFKVDMPDDMISLCKENFNTEVINEKISPTYIIDRFNQL